jgi:dTDP-4-dehydrorhamnose 3,5-epimerase
MIDQASILIVGKGGQLATALKSVFPGALFVGRPEFDIADTKTYTHVDWEKIKIIINASAYTSVDEAETDVGRREAWGVNAAGVRSLSLYAQKYHCTLVHISTDYVFDGRTENHNETESVSPLNVYGQSKAAGEMAVSLLPEHYIIRTQWLIGSGKNFVRTMYELGKKGVSPKVVNDQFGRLTFTNSLADFIAYLLEHAHAYGTYHFSNTGTVASWAEIASEIFHIMRYDTNVIPITTEEFAQDKSPFARRPTHCDFDLSKMSATGFITRDWKTKLTLYLETI